VVRALQVSEVTYYRWRKEYGGMRVDQAKRLKEVWYSPDFLEWKLSSLSQV
jgi:putative transposase